MEGCNVPVNINVEDILGFYTDKFSQNDIKLATKAYMKYRAISRLVSIEKNYGIIKKIDNSYEILDLSQNNLIKNLDLKNLSTEDAFKLGMHFKKIQLEKDKKLFQLVKSESNLVNLTLVSKNDK